jgi:hypothetical protein
MVVPLQVEAMPCPNKQTLTLEQCFHQYSKTNPAQYQKREAGTGDLLKAMPWFLIYHCKSSRGASKYAHATLSYNMKTEKIKY